MNLIKDSEVNNEDINLADKVYSKYIDSIKVKSICTKL